MSRTPQELALRDWVLLGTGLDEQHVIFAGQPGAPPRPSLPYATVTVLTETLADSETTMSDTALGAGYEYDIDTQGSGTVSVQIFGDGARLLMRDLVQSLHLPAVQVLLSTRGVHPTAAGSGGIAITQAPISTSFEPRTSQDFAYTFSISSTHEVGAIEEVVVTGATI